MPRKVVKADKPSPNGVIDVVVVLLEAGYASTAIGPLEVFDSAGQLWNWLNGTPPKPRFRVRIASLDGRKVTSLCSLGLVPQCAIADIRQADIIIVPASGWDVQARIARESALIPWLRKWHTRGAAIAGICSGVAFLAEAGLLDGREATTHWGIAEILRQRYPKVRWRPEHFVTDDGGAMCSGGIYASLDLSLYLVEKFCGHEVAVQTARSLLLSMPRSRQSGFSVTTLSRPHSDETIKASEQHLQRNFAKDVSIEQLAERARMSPRTFLRRFKAATGRMPGAYLQMLRITAARDLLERDAGSVQVVCEKVGYEDVAFFRTLFKRHTGMTPAEYRGRFGRMAFDRGELSGAAAE